MLRAPLALCALALFATLAPADVCVVRRASLDAGGGEGDGHSRKPSISADGDWIAFESLATDLVPGDTNGVSDVFVKHVPTGAIERVSIQPASPGSSQANGSSYHASLSADARYVVFESDATNLAAGDTNGVRDVFLHDRQLDQTRRVNVASSGVQANGPSGAAGLWRGSAISGDGTTVAFQSFATNLVPGDTNGSYDVFVHVHATGTTTRVSYRPSGGGGTQSNGPSQDPALSFTGRYVAYVSSANNLVSGDTNGVHDLFVLDRVADVLVRASVDSGGAESDGGTFQPSLSWDGQRVVFESTATNLVPGDTNAFSDVFLRDLAVSTTERVSVGWLGQQADDYAYRASISGDGARVGFTSAASNLVPGGNGIQNVYVRDLVADTTERWGEDAAGGTGFAGTDDASLSADGYELAFLSLATLVPDDANGLIDVYQRRCGPTGTPYCGGTDAACPCGNGGTAGAGCDNSHATGGGLLLADGYPSVSADTVTLLATGLPPTTPILFFQGTSEVNGGQGLPFGDGLRCAGGSVIRLGTRAASGGAASFGEGNPSDPAISVQGAIPPAGASLRYQGWYRDTQPFCQPEGFNFTNGLRIDWAP